MISLARLGALSCTAVVSAGLAGCSGGGLGSSASTSSGNAVTIQGDVPLAYAKRANTFTMNPTAGAPGAPGGDLIIRELSSPSAREYNVTASITQGVGDVADPEVSYDGKKIVFSMRCPASNTSKVGTPPQPACTGRWNVWEYDMSSGGLSGGSFRRITSSANDDDVHPVYLPKGRGFVFTSNRQTSSYAKQALNRSYYALDEYERERVFQLHTMDADGGNITQISVNQSHDRSPVVRPDGDIMYSRWDHVGDRNRFTIFRTKPDGEDMFVLYGAHSDGNSFLHPRDMDPNGRYKGFVVTDLMPLQRTQEGGALMLIDVARYSEQNAPVNSSVPAQGGQRQMTEKVLNIDRGLSQYGRVTTPYPLWDGTDRILISFTPCQVTDTKIGAVVPCTNLTAQEIANLSDQSRLLADVRSDQYQANVPPSYGIYMFDPASQTMRPVAMPPLGYMYVHPVAIMPRAEPAVKTPSVDANMAQQGLAEVEIRSVYDTDSLGRMGDPVLVPADLPPGCSTSIAKTAPLDPTIDTRPQVADLVAIKDPANPAYLCAPARFIRVTRAVAPPSNTLGLRRAIGQTNFEGQQILGYAVVEPDGSFKLDIPGDLPVAVSVVDSQGRAFQVHSNWIQARPGERRTCDGCHGLRRGGALNSGSIVDSVPAAWLPMWQPGGSAGRLTGETMASTHARFDSSVLGLSGDLVYNDVWADISKSGVTARPSINISYSGLTTPAPVNGIINYPDNIQPLWSVSRGPSGAYTCTNCHADPTKLDLRATMAGTGRLASYEKLLVGDPLLDANGQPVMQVQNGIQVVARGPALVDPRGSEGDAVGIARKSRLTEILFGQQLLVDAAARVAFPDPPASAPSHAVMLNASEKRLIAEWMDLGGQYFNDPYNAASGVRDVQTLNQTTFEQQVFPILQTTCAANCHQGVGSTAVPAGTNFVDNRYVLTGDPTGDLNSTLAMINDTCNMASNPLVTLPSTVPHPGNAVGQTAPVLSGANLTAITNWISSGCPTP
jgi:hypothetical protein